MKEFSFPTPPGLGSTVKLFSKIYNVFYCSKKPEQAAVADEADEAGRLKADWFDAIKAEDVAKIEELITKGVDVSIEDEHGWTGVHLAAWNGHVEVCRTLLKHKCDINSGGSTALALASQKGHLEIVTLLLEADSDVQKTARLGDSMDVTALHLAAQNGHEEIVRLLVKAGAIVNASMTVRGIKGVTPLHLAVEAGHLDVMDILIEAGCDIHSSTQDGSETSC